MHSSAYIHFGNIHIAADTHIVTLILFYAGGIIAMMVLACALGWSSPKSIKRVSDFHAI